jgi:hypothetical protein
MAARTRRPVVTPVWTSSTAATPTPMRTARPRGARACWTSDECEMRPSRRPAGPRGPRRRDGLAALVLTEVNLDHDPDGSLVERLVQVLVAALGQSA